jgi:MFS transporter, DHA2 family, multidrug resistance protein
MSTVPPGSRPARSALVMLTVILGAIVANINTSISNVALPDIGEALNASNTQLTAITDAYQVAIAATVVYLGAVGDRYGRRKLLILGALLSVPFSLLSAWAGSPAMLIAAQMLVGIAGGMLYPTTLSLIRGLYSGAARTRGIALWAGVGGGASALGPILGGVLLENFWWGSVFLITVPFSIVVAALAWFVIPRRTGEHADAVDHPGGVLSVLMISTFVLGIIQMPRGITPTVIALFGVALVSGALFAWRELRTPTPIFDLRTARVPTFWVAFVGGLAAFGALTGSLFIGQSYSQDVLGKDPLDAVLLTIPLPVLLISAVPLTNRLMNSIGTRMTLTLGLVMNALGFGVMMALWREDAALIWVPVAYGLLGLGVGLASAPASRALSNSVPVSRAGMASAASDLTKDMGGAIYQALLGALLTFAYSSYFTRAFDRLPANEAEQLGTSAATQIGSSYAGAERVAATFPEADREKIIEAARLAFTDGKTAAIAIALISTVLGALIVFLFYPRPEHESEIFRSAGADDGTVRQ